MGEATKGVITASRNNIEQIGSHAKDAAISISDIVNAAKNLIENVGYTSKYEPEIQNVRDTSTGIKIYFFTIIYYLLRISKFLLIKRSCYQTKYC